MAYKSFSYKVYSIRTPKYNHQKEIDEGKEKSHFEFQVVDLFFKLLKHTKIEEIFINTDSSYNTGKNSITFYDYIDIDNDYSVVVFDSDSYGTSNVIKDMNNREVIGHIKKEHSVPHKVNVFINKNNGLIFVSKDKNSIINKTTLQQFFYKYREVMYEYVEIWNENNKYYKIYKWPFIRMDNLPSMNFFDEMEKLLNIKEFSYEFDPTGSKDFKDFSADDVMLKEGFRRKNFKERRTFINFLGKASISQIKELYEKLFYKSNYDNFKVVGHDKHGKPKTVKPNFKTRSISLNLPENTFYDYKIVIEKLKKSNFTFLSKDIFYKNESMNDIDFQISDFDLENIKKIVLKVKKEQNSK